MPVKTYQIPDDEPMMVAEPAVAYGRDTVYDRDAAWSLSDVEMRHVSTDISSSSEWNPNVPFHGTQEEWWEHFHRIEIGNFTPLEEANKEFETWKKNYLANRLK